jgi:cAMP-binding proteins - catabolite gene activator and regulatory subunit of cAMP-dependent protein kinases
MIIRKMLPSSRSPNRNREPTTKQDYLLTMDIFRDLSPEDIHAIKHQTFMRSCAKGQILYSQNDRAEALFLLKRGQVQLYRLTPGGKRLELATLDPGTFFGEMPLLGETLRHTYAEVTEEALVCVMSRTDVERMIETHPSVALHMIEVMGKRLAAQEERLEELAYRHVPARIAAALLRLSQNQPEVTLTLTHQEIGDMIGALRETVTPILNAFQRKGLVTLGRGRIVVHDLAGLRTCLEEK